MQIILSNKILDSYGPGNPYKYGKINEISIINTENVQLLFNFHSKVLHLLLEIKCIKVFKL